MLYNIFVEISINDVKWLLSSKMSWVGCLLKDSELFILFGENRSSFTKKIFLKFQGAYSHLFNKRGAWNKRGGGAKVATSLNVELGINEEGGIFGKN